MQYLKNIRQQLCKGTLSHEGAERLMLDAIEKEAEKESADYDWIEACCQFLDEDIPVDDVQADWPDHQQSNWAAIQSAIRQEQGTEKGIACARCLTGCIGRAACRHDASGHAQTA